MKKGSITIFALLSMILIVSMLFALLETSRFHQIKYLADLQTQVSLESLFAGYNTFLWEEYRILACNQKEMVRKLDTYGNGQIVEKGANTNFFQFRVKEVEVCGYTRLVDGEGTAFIQAATDYMRENFLYETAQTIYNQYEGIKNMQENSGYSLLEIDHALKKLKDGNENEQVVNQTKRNENGIGVLEFIRDLQKKGILSLVLQNQESLSEKKFESTDKLSTRELPEAYHPEIQEVDWYSKVLFQQYILTYLSSFMNEGEHALDYEVEYALVGADSDIDNLKGTVQEILSIRTAANYLFLSTNTSKMASVNAFALGIVGVSANPILIEIVKCAILAAWAFAESILDIRTLLTGGKISLLKSDTTWTLSIEEITTLNAGYPKAKNCENGLSYKEYLGILLLLQEDKQMASRVMDVLELTLRKKNESASICLEDWIIETRIHIKYTYQPVFFSIENVIPSWHYEFSVKEDFAY